MCFSRIGKVISGLFSIFLVGIAYAGSLSPSANPAATSFTLEDIYTRLTTNSPATSGSHDFAPSVSPAGSMHTLSDVYGAIPTISGSKVLRRTTYLGIAGAAYGSTNSGAVAATATVSGVLLWNQFNGSYPGTGTGDSFAFGGADWLGSTDGYVCPMGWTQCTAGNAYCGTGLASSDAKDNCTGLVWSHPCNGSGCSVLAAASPYPAIYSNNNTYRNNSSKTASQLCMSGNHGESGWYLPHLKMILQAYVDGSSRYIYDSAVPPSPYYSWSATRASNSTSLAYAVAPWSQNTLVAMGTAYFVRCVRPAL